jgi:hypothetical protein
MLREGEEQPEATETGSLSTEAAKDVQSPQTAASAPELYHGANGKEAKPGSHPYEAVMTKVEPVADRRGRPIQREASRLTGAYTAVNGDRRGPPAAESMTVPLNSQGRATHCMSHHDVPLKTASGAPVRQLNSPQSPAPEQSGLMEPRRRREAYPSHYAAAAVAAKEGGAGECDEGGAGGGMGRSWADVGGSRWSPVQSRPSEATQPAAEVNPAVSAWAGPVQGAGARSDADYVGLIEGLYRHIGVERFQGGSVVERRFRVEPGSRRRRWQAAGQRSVRCASPVHRYSHRNNDRIPSKLI